MGKRTEEILEAMRELMPMGTLMMMNRPLTWYEAQGVSDRQSSRLLKELGIVKPSVEIELLLEQTDIELVTEADMPLSGYADWDQEGEHWRITLNQDESLWRSRANLAHELKHIIDDPFREVLYPDWPRGTLTVPPPEAEAICDYFAGCVLVPAGWLSQVWQDGTRDVSGLAALFAVSERLMRVRLRQVKPERASTRRLFGGYGTKLDKPGGTGGFAMKRDRPCGQPCRSC